MAGLRVVRYNSAAMLLPEGRVTRLHSHVSIEYIYKRQYCIMRNRQERAEVTGSE